jgi:DNA-binding transcriptional LysR family regulator
MDWPGNANQLEAFRAVVLSGTTVAAARMLHTTQPSISRLIHQAQNASGLKLFVNDRGRLQLTREGRHLFETVQLHFQGFERIEQTVSALRASGAGVFRIASTPSLAQGILPAVLQRFTASWPQVHLNVQTTGSRQIEEGLRQGQYDIAPTNTPFEGAEFHMHEVHQGEAVLVCAPDHPLRGRASVGVVDLKDQTLISLPAHDVLELEIARAFAARKQPRPVKIETVYSATICAFAAQGLGVGIVNPYMASVFRDRVCIRRFVPRLPVRTFAVSARFAPASELAERFLEELKNVVRGDTWSVARLATALR